MNARVLLASLLLALPALAREPKIVIDAGHGGSQQGALSPTGYLEKELARVGHPLAPMDIVLLRTGASAWAGPRTSRPRTA